VENRTLPQLSYCPNCKSKLKDILYGLIAEPVDEEKYVIGGCDISEDAPTKKCSSCDWEGGLGGRTWDTAWVIRNYKEDPTASGGEILTEEEFDLCKLNVDELQIKGRTLIEARFELVHRGKTPEEVEELFEDAPSMPLIEKWEAFLFYNTETNYIERVALFSAHWRFHTFSYLADGALEWEIATTLKDFHDAVFSMKREDIEVWSIDIPEDFSDGDFMSDPSNYGSHAIRKFISKEQITADELFKEGGFFKTPIFWPHWFDPGLMLNQFGR
jgi:hypothetical protein